MKNSEFVKGLENHGNFLNTKISAEEKESLFEILFVRGSATHGDLTAFLKTCKNQHEGRGNGC